MWLRAQGLPPKLLNSKWLIDPLNDVQKSFTTTRFKGNELRFYDINNAVGLFSMLISVANQIYCEDGGHWKKFMV